jgi:hypothetical protein
MESSNNVVDLEEFRKRKKESLPKPSAQLTRFVEAYHDAEPEALDVYTKSIRLLRAYGFEVEDFNKKDVLLLREALFSIILRYREEHHPLHSFVEDFDKYFNKLEYYLDTEWSNAEHLDPNEEEPI